MTIKKKKESLADQIINGTYEPKFSVKNIIPKKTSIVDRVQQRLDNTSNNAGITDRVQLKNNIINEQNLSMADRMKKMASTYGKTYETSNNKIIKSNNTNSNSNNSTPSMWSKVVKRMGDTVQNYSERTPYLVKADKQKIMQSKKADESNKIDRTLPVLIQSMQRKQNKNKNENEIDLSKIATPTLEQINIRNNDISSNSNLKLTNKKEEKTWGDKLVEAGKDPKLLGNQITTSAKKTGASVPYSLLTQATQGYGDNNALKNSALYTDFKQGSYGEFEQKMKLQNTKMHGLKESNIEKTRQNLKKYINEQNMQIQENINNASNEISKKLLELTPSMVQSGIGAGITAGATALGGAGIGQAIGTAFFSETAFADYYDDAIERGLTGAKANKYATAMAFWEGASEEFITSERLIPSQTMKAFLGGVGKDVVENFAQEALTDPLQEILAKASGGDYDIENLKENMIRDGFDGALTSLIMFGATNGIPSSINIAQKLNNGDNISPNELKTAWKDLEKVEGKEVLEAQMENGIQSTINEMLQRANQKLDGVSRNNIIENSNLSDESKASLLRVAEKHNMSTEEVQNLINNPPNEQVLQSNQQIPQQQSKMAQNETSQQQRDLIQDLQKFNETRQEGQEIFDINNEETRKEIESIQKVAENRGINITFDENRFKDNNTNAFYEYDEKGNVANIVLNPNSTSKKYVQNLVIHEMTHSFEGSKQYDSLSKAILDYAKSKGEYDKAFNDLMNTYSKVYSGENLNKIVEKEAVANILGEKLGDKEFVDSLVNNQYVERSTIQKIIDFVKNQINRFKGYRDQEAYWNHVKTLFEDAYNKSKVSQEGLKQSVETNNLSERIKELEKRLNGEKVTRKQKTLIDSNTGKYIARNIEGEYFGLTDDKNKAITNSKDIEKALNSKKFFKKKNIDLQESTVEQELYKKLPYSEVQRIKNEIESLKHGFTNVTEYLTNKEKILKEEADEKENKINNSFIGKNYRKNLDLYYRDGNNIIINKTPIIELFSRYAKKNGAKEIYHSAKNKSKFSSSVYLKIGDYEIRLSDHYLPETSEREYNQTLYGTRWNNEVVLDENEIDFILNIKNEKEFNNYVLSKFNQDIRYSQDTTGAWNNFIEKYFKNEGTGTAIKDMKKLPEMSITKYQEVLDNAKHIPQEEKTYLLETVKDIKRNKTSLEDFKNTIETMEKAYSEQNENILDTKKTYSTGRKETYQKYMKANTEYDSSSLENAKNIVPANHQGRRTKAQWLNIAKQMGTEIANKSNAEIEEIAYRTWQDERPSNKESLNRQGDKFVQFTSDEWINTIYDAVKGQREKYSIDTGENKGIDYFDEDLQAIRENSIENIIDGKSRKHYKTYSKSLSLSAKDRQQAQKLYYEEKYMPVGNVDTLTKANERIKRNGIDTEYASSVAKFNNNEKMTLEDVVTMERMIQMYSSQGDYKKVNNLMQNVAILGTELGQRVQALSIIKKMSPEGRLQMLRKLVDRTNQKENSNLKITDEQAERILKSNGEKELNDNVSKVVEEVAEDLKVTLGDEIRGWRYLSMLGNPRTHIRNLVGNVAMNGLQNIKNKVAGAGEDVASKFNPNLERTKTLRRANQDQRDFAKIDAFKMEDDIDGGGKYDMNNLLQNAKRSSNLKPLNAIEKFNSNLLDVEDKIFLRKAYEQAMRGYMVANKLSSKDMNEPKTLEKARKYATKQAQEATFHQYSALASQLNQIEKKGGVGGFLTSAVLPFKKTPINIAKTGVEYSPVGIFQAVGNTVKNVTKDTQNYKTQLEAGKITQEQYNTAISEMVNSRIDQMAKGLTGTSIALIGYALAKSGILKAGNGDEEDEFEEKLGNQKYSVKIGDQSFSLDWLAPSAIPLFVGANLNNLINGNSEEEEEEEGFYDRLGKFVNNTATSMAQAFEPMTEMSMLQGLASSLSSFEQDSSNKIFDLLSSAGQSYVGQFVPTALGQVTKTIDPVIRDTTSTKKGMAKKIDQLVNQTKSKIPGLSQTLPAKVNVWGEDKERPENGLVRFLENAVLPYNREKIIEDTTSEKLKEVYETTGERGALPGTLQKYITINSQKYNLNNKEFNQSKRVYGQVAKKTLDKVVNTKEFKNLDSGMKLKFIQDIYSYAKEEFKSEYANNKNIEFEHKVSNSKKKYNAYKEFENNQIDLEELIKTHYTEK